MSKEKMKKSRILLLGICILVSLSACAKKAEAAGETAQKEQPMAAGSAQYYPLTLKSGNAEIVIEKMPEKAVVFGYENAEFMAALGLADKIAYFYGGHQTIDAVLPQYRDQLKDIKNLENDASIAPSLEHLLNYEPDVIILPSYMFFLEGFGTKEDYAQHNIPLYVLEGTYAPHCTIENTYNDIINVGKIFHKEAEAVQLVEQMKTRIAAVAEKMKDKKEVNVLAFDCELNGKLVTWGSTGLAHNLLTLAKGKNIFADIEKQFPHVSWEELVNSNPDLIIIDAYENDNGGQAKVDMLKSNPLTAELDAVKNDRFLIIPLFSIFPGLQNVNAVENISDAILKIGNKQ